MISIVEAGDVEGELPEFTPIVTEWMRRTFEAPTQAQRAAWPVIAGGKNTLVFSPTGSGKTLAAFLWAIHELVSLGNRGSLPEQPYVVYISPLRALANDVEKNLLAPLREMKEISAEQGATLPDIRVGVRTGDTLPEERQKMLRRPPQILITTPESLYLLLSSGFRDHLRSVRYVIVDEIHHLCGNKRGAHLAISLERLEELALRRDARESAEGEPTKGFVRIGLSATQSPVQDIARFLVGCEDGGAERDCAVVDLGVRRDMDVRVITAVPNLVEAKPEEIWDAIHEQLFDLILSHRTTLIFCNSRHLTERVAAKLNMLAEARGGGPRIGAHHGSMSRVLRLEMEEGLKSGALRAVVATSSLELGIDIGHLDLVCQVESPKSVAAGLQRVGRAGHLLGLTSKGRLFATTRDDLVELAVLARAMCEGSLEPVHIPENCLDVAAQQAAAMAAVEGRSASGMLRTIRRAYTFRTLREEDFTRVLEQLSGRSGDRELFEMRALVNWDRADDRAGGARGALGLVLQNAGTIPETAEYAVHAEDYQKKLGTLDENFVQRLRPGRIFVLGTRTWEFLRVDRNRVYVRDSRGRAPTIPRWAGIDDVPRSFQLGEQIASFRSTMFARLFEQPEGLQSWLAEEYVLDESGAQQIIEYFVEQAHSLDTWPGRDTLVAETSRNPLGHQQVLVHSPYGGRLNEAWAEALAQAAQQALQAELQVVYTDNAFALHLPRDCEASVGDVLALVTSENLGQWIDSYVRQSALFSIKFRHAAVRALAVPRMISGRKRPIWQQDAIAKRLEREVEELPLFPLNAETVREAMEDHLDLTGLRRLLDEVASGRTRLVSTEVEVPSPFGHELLLTGQFGAMGEMSRRERRAELLSLHREVLKQILDEESIRDLLAPKVVEDFEARREGTAATARARDAEELLRLIRRCGDLSESPESGLFIGRRAGAGWREWLDALRRERRAVPIVVPRALGDERRWIAAEDFFLYARAFGDDPPDDARCERVLGAIRSAGEASTADLERVAGKDTGGVLDALERAYAVVRSREEKGEPYWAIPEEWLPGIPPEKLSRRAARRRVFLRALRVAGPVAVEDLSVRYGLTQRATTAVLSGLLETGEVQQGGFVKGRATPQVCTTANLEELHRRALAALRREVEPVGLDRYVDFLLKWQHAHPKSKLEGGEGIRAVMAQQAGYRAYPRVWEREIIGLRVRDADRPGIVSAVSSGDVRAGQFNLGEKRARPLLAATTFVPGERAAQFVELPSTEDCSSEEIAVLRLLRKEGDAPAARIATGTSLPETDVERTLWRLFRTGLASNTDYSAIARCGWTSAPRWESGLFGGAETSEEEAAPESSPDGDDGEADLRRAGLRAGQGSWYAVQSVADRAQDDDALGRRRRTRVMTLMQRYGIAAREVLLAKSDMSTQDVSRGLRELFLRGQLLRGFFIRSLSGDQFALPEALERLRKEAVAKSEPALMVSSVDPAAVHLTAVKLPGMQNRPLPTRYLVLHRGELEAIVDRHPGEGRFLRARDVRLFHPSGASRPQRAALHKRVATAMLEYAIRWGAWEAVRISHVDGQPVYEQTEVAGDLAEAGFRLVRGELSYRLRKRVGAADETAMRRIVKTEEQKREDIRLTSKPVLDFYHHIITEYTPPPDKDMLVIFQCSVSRPFSKSPSHSSMRKAIRLATGKDPKDDFEDCRCHVVVLASMIGPVPYEMETVYPADERGGGVKHMSDYEYHLAKPILAKRMAAYLRRWHERYKVITTFTHSRYGDVMREARKLAGLDFPILPDMNGTRLKRGNQYWTRYWIQLFFELLEGMTEAERAEAMARLDREDVAIDYRSGRRRSGAGRRR